MGYKKIATFAPPKLSEAKTVEELRVIIQKWAEDLCSKLNRELTDIERTTA